MTEKQVILGDVLQLFTMHGASSAVMTSIGGATNHTLTITPEYTDITCKDAGIFGWKKLNKINWEIQTENLFVAGEYKALLKNALGDFTFTVYFGTSNWSENGVAQVDSYWTPKFASDANSYGTVYDNTSSSTDTGYRFADDNSGTNTVKCIYKGKVKISSLTLNAQTGETASYSATLTGVGPFEEVTSLS